MTDEEQRDAAHEAVSTLVARIEPGAMVNRFVLLVETVGTDGERAMWTLAPNDAKTWDSLGLMDFARSLEYGAEQGQA